MKAVKQDEEWGEIKLAADSGATDTVIFAGDLPSIELRSVALSSKWRMVLSGPTLARKCWVVAAEAEAQSVVAQVVEVS